MDDDEEYPPCCPRCESKEVVRHEEYEYTGGGYADRWTEYECKKCGNYWRSDKKTNYF